MFEEALLTLRGRIAYGAGVVAMAEVLHLDMSLVLLPPTASSLLVVPPLLRPRAPEVAEDPREPLSQQRAQGRQAGGHDAQARLDGVEARAPPGLEAAILGLVEGLGEHADPYDSDHCDSVKGGRGVSDGL